jgi:hypothetical protein
MTSADHHQPYWSMTLNFLGSGCENVYDDNEQCLMWVGDFDQCGEPPEYFLTYLVTFAKNDAVWPGQVRLCAKHCAAAREQLEIIKGRPFPYPQYKELRVRSMTPRLCEFQGHDLNVDPPLLVYCHEMATEFFTARPGGHTYTWALCAEHRERWRFDSWLATSAPDWWLEP